MRGRRDDDDDATHTHGVAVGVERREPVEPQRNLEEALLCHRHFAFKASREERPMHGRPDYDEDEDGDGRARRRGTGEEWDKK